MNAERGGIHSQPLISVWSWKDYYLIFLKVLVNLSYYHFLTFYSFYFCRWIQLLFSVSDEKEEKEQEDQGLEELEEQIGHRDERKKGKGSTFFCWQSLGMEARLVSNSPFSCLSILSCWNKRAVPPPLLLCSFLPLSLFSCPIVCSFHRFFFFFWQGGDLEVWFVFVVCFVSETRSSL